MRKITKKLNVTIMEPNQLHRDSLVYVLNEFLSERVKVTRVVTSISEVMHSIILKGPSDIYIMEAFGQNENYRNWSDFTHFMATHYPLTVCLVWSSKPTMFLKKSNEFNIHKRCWQLPKKIDVKDFVHFLTLVFEGDASIYSCSNSCIGPPMSNITLSEMIIITHIIDGYGIKRIAKKYGVAYKTVSTHKRNAMMKMRISTTAQLRSLFIDGYIIRGDELRNLPINFNVNKPICL